MKSVLKEFWYGNISPFEEFYPNTRKMQKLSELIAVQHAELLTHLPEQKQSLLEKYDNTVLELDNLSNEELFTYAFSLGLRFGAECFFKG